MGWLLLPCFVFGLMLWPTTSQNAVPDSVLNCCEGDILLLLDSSGSVSSYEFSRLLQFLSELLHPFSLGRGRVRVGLLQVGTHPRLEFDLDAHNTQDDLKKALLRTRQLRGDTNTVAALRLAQKLLARVETEGGPRGLGEFRKVLLWLTDAVQPGDVQGLMKQLRDMGVAVLAVSTGHGNYQMLRRTVTPPIESHLYFVDIDDIKIIKEDLRDAIVELLRAERLRVVHLTSRSAVLQWRPVLGADSGYYELRYNCVWDMEGSPHRDSSCTTGQYHKRTLPGDARWEELTNLRPDTTYTASLTPESNQEVLSTLSVTFTTLPELLSPEVVLVSDFGPHQVRVSWGPLQAERVRRYRVEYGAFPKGRVQIVMLHSQQNSTLLTGLEPDTEYLVTVSALHATGRERAMSVKVCTQEAAVHPGLSDLQLSRVEQGEVQVRWKGPQEGPNGYWLSWRRGTSHISPIKRLPSPMYLSSGSLSTRLPHLAPGGQVCVSPVYTSARGDGICCTPGTDLTHWGHQ